MKSEHEKNVESWETMNELKAKAFAYQRVSRLIEDIASDMRWRHENLTNEEEEFSEEYLEELRTEIQALDKIFDFIATFKY